MTCDGYSWTDPVPVDSGAPSHATIVRFSSIASRARRTFIVGNDVSEGATDVGRSTLVLREIGGRPIDPPPGDFTFAFPRAAIDANGNLHLLWGEPMAEGRPTSMTDWMLQTIRSIWAAQFDPTSHTWSEPRMLVSTQVFPVDWSQAVLTRPRGRAWEFSAAVLMPLTDPTGPRGPDIGSSVSLVRLAHGRWSTTTVALPGRAIYAVEMSDTNMSILAYVGSVGAGAPDNTVVIMRSTDGGETWSHPAAIGESPTTAPIDGLAIVGDAATMHVLWKQVVAGGTHVMRHRGSADHGVTWSEPSDLVLPKRIGGESTVLDVCGNVHVVFGAVGEGKMLELRHAVFAKQWATPAMLFPSLVTYSAHLSRSDDGGVLLSFVGIPRDAQSASGNTTYISALSLR